MIQRINLLPKELRTASKRTFYFIASLSIILYLSTLYVVNNLHRVNVAGLEAKRDSLRQSVASLAKQDAKYREVIDMINMTESKNKEMGARAGLVSKITGGNTRWSDPLYELSHIVPAGLWLSSLSSSDIMAGDKKFKGMRVSGMAFSNSRITDFMAALETSPFFEGVSLAYVQNTEYIGREAFSFEITFRNTYVTDGTTTTSNSESAFNPGIRHDRKVVDGNSSSRNIAEKATDLSAPALNSPPDNARDIPTTGQTFSWSIVPGASDYRVVVDTSPTFSNYDATNRVCSNTANCKTYITEGNTAISYNGFIFSPATKYYWKVVAGNPSAGPNWATSRNFTTKATDLSAPALNSPPDNAVDVPTTGQTFSWSNVSGASDYRVVVDTSPTFSNYDATNRVCSNTANCKTYVAEGNKATSYNGFTFNPGTKYYWKVVAGNPSAGPNWATPRNFTARTGGKE